MTGVIKKIVADRAFGFITVEGRDKDLFFHQDKVVGGEAAFKELKEGDKVTFDEDTTGPKGPAAVNVQKVQ